MISVKRQVHLCPTMPRMKQSKPDFKIQWNFDITKGQCYNEVLLCRGSVFLYFTITGARNSVPYTEDFHCVEIL